MPRRGRDSRQAAEARGRQSETIAALWMRLKGYAVIASRVRESSGEIDIILRKGRLIVFAEVKARPTIDLALSAVTSRNWQRIAMAAESWMARRPDLQSHGWRYDLIALAPGRLPAHIADAWRPGLG